MTDVPDRRESAPGDHDTDVVELGVPARTAYVSVLRTTAAALAARLDFTIDEIEDLRIAVDEASAILLSQAVPDSQLSCRFQLARSELVVEVSVRSRNPKVPSRTSFAWTVLTALAGQVDTFIDPDEGRTTVTLTKHGEVARPGASAGSGHVRELDDARQSRRRDAGSKGKRGSRGNASEPRAASIDNAASASGTSSKLPTLGTDAADT